jgi:hypothetical protein
MSVPELQKLPMPIGSWGREPPRLPPYEPRRQGPPPGPKPQCNPFLLLGGAEPEKTPQRLYAVLDQIEIGADGVHLLTFGALDADWLDERADELAAYAAAENFDPVFNPMPLFILEISLSTDAVVELGHRGVRPLTADSQRPSGHAELPAALFRTALSLERRWTSLALGTGAGGSLYKNLFGDAVPVALASIDDAAFATRQLLIAVDPLKNLPDANEPQIRAALASIGGASSVDGIVVYDVGQGGANGLTSGGRVEAYFDFGGGVTSHRGTFPPSLQHFCFCTQTPPIVLSHWDHDHWSSEGRDTRSHATTWIVPRQSWRRSKRSQHHNALIASIRRHGTLHIWPSSLSSVTIGQCRIIKCTGTTKNTSGLAMEVHPPAGVPGFPMLLPADAGYDDIPACHAASYDAIACPHHGGRSTYSVVPARPPGAYPRLAYSYGLGNSHKHPLPNTQQDHHRAGWLDPRQGATHPGEVRNTVDRLPSGLGHIGFDWGRGSMPPVPCGTSCELDVQQY